ncbi:MAG TPA: CBS domain-containing protein, partial [Candidatus Binatus sp.]|nr:CBS domain-containing protein [Candidatus Binatus sp.]
MTEITERDVADRVPTLTDEKLKMLGRRDPLTVSPGTSLAECYAQIQRTGTADSVFVTDPDGKLLGVLTERDIFGKLVASGADLTPPVETMM